MFLASLFSLNALFVFLASLVALYFYLIPNFNYWSSRGVPGPKPIVIMGTLYKMFSMPFHEIPLVNAKKYGKVYGDYIGSRPALTVSDPELIKEMNIRDFNVFVDHMDQKMGDPLSDRSLFNLTGDEWKSYRSIISPTFSSGKMRAMHPIIIDCVHRLEDYLEKKAIGGQEIELKRVMGNLTMDVIAACAFGTKIDTHNDQQINEFVQNAKSVFRGNWRIWLVTILITISPKLNQWLGVSPNSPTVKHFFKSAIKSIIARRRSETKSTKHKDYLKLIIYAQNKSKFK